MSQNKNTPTAGKQRRGIQTNDRDSNTSFHERPSAQQRCNYPINGNVSPVSYLLSRLEKVRPVGKGRWVALCPGHADKNPSLNIKECSDGTVLVKCWAGCTANEIVSAVHLKLTDLFPNKTSFVAQRPHRIRDDELLEAVLCIKIAKAEVKSGHRLSASDVETVETARALLARRLAL